MKVKILFNKYGRLFQGLGLAVILVVLTATVVTPAPAYGDRATIDLDPRKGPVGTKIIVVLSNFEPGIVDISFDAEANIVESVSTNDDGNAYSYFIAEEYPAGEYKVWAKDSENREYTVFTITPEIEIDNTGGCVGDEIVVTGTGFAAKSEISITVDGDEVIIDKTDEDGVFTGAKFSIPESSNGEHTIRAIDKVNNYVDTIFDTEQSITISAAQGGVGTGFTASGTGFASNSDITIIFADQEIATTTADKKGSFSATLVVPAMAKDTYRIKISDGKNSGYADFSIQSDTTLNPTQGNVGSELTVSGSGYQSNSNITIKYDDTKVATAKIDANGNFEVSFNAPVSNHGEHIVTLSDDTTVLEMTFTMESEPPPVPRLLLPSNGAKVAETPDFDWEAVTDPSGITYSLQVASDNTFSNLVVDKSGLTEDEYVVTSGESLPPVKEEFPYYWRVKATDQAQNESEWSAKGSFYMGISIAAPPGWVQWGLTGLGITLFGFLFMTFLNKLRRFTMGD
jgi:hypothetical protein